MEYNIFVKQHKGRFRASVVGWSEISAEADSQKDALDDIRRQINAYLSEGTFVRMVVEGAETQLNEAHPLARFGGIFKDDPTFDEFQENLIRYRKEGNERAY